MTITELADLLGLKTATLRYYEDIGLITANRATNGNREYDPEQVDRAKRVVLFRHAGVSIKELEQLFSNEMSDQSALKMLEEAKRRIEIKQAKLQETMDFLDYKTKWHEEQIRKSAQISQEQVSGK